jgi:hypothetical protein
MFHKSRAKKDRVLFVLKRREDYGQQHYSSVGLSTGLFNSATFVKDMLVDLGFEAQLQVAIDNNCIDRMVTAYKPTHVVIEALWVVPEKFNILRKLHPNVMWIIRMHSDIPFLSMEGQAMGWLLDYLKQPNVLVAFNSERILREFGLYAKTAINYDASKLLYLPNYYPTTYVPYQKKSGWGSINISSFGAIRPLKNQLMQAFAALDFCRARGLALNFHINAGRVEGKGDPILKNLRDFFKNLAPAGHKLVEHEWCPRDEFLKICSQMDIGLQVSFSETFNIVAADQISQGVPVITSPEVPWTSQYFVADPTNMGDISRILQRTYNHAKINVVLNQHMLTNYSRQTQKDWLKYFK